MNDLSDHHEYEQDEVRVQKNTNVLVIVMFLAVIAGFATAPQASVSLPMFFAFIWACFALGMRKCPPVSVTMSVCILFFAIVVVYFGSVPAWQANGFAVWWL